MIWESCFVIQSFVYNICNPRIVGQLLQIVTNFNGWNQDLCLCFHSTHQLMHPRDIKAFPNNLQLSFYFKFSILQDNNLLILKWQEVFSSLVWYHLHSIIVFWSLNMKLVKIRYNNCKVIQLKIPIRKIASSQKSRIGHP